MTESRENVAVEVVRPSVPATEIRQRLREIKSNLQEGFFSLGPILYELWIHEEYWRGWGYRSWQDCVDNEVGLSYRTVMYLLGIYRWCVIENRSPEMYERMKEIGWTKARSLTCVVLPENLEEWVEKAKATPTSRFEVAVRSQARPAQVVQAEASEPLNHRLTMNLSETMWSNVIQAIERVSELNGGDPEKGIGHKVDLICTDFLATNSFMANGRQNIAYFLQKFESLLGIKLVAIDMKEREVLWGVDTVQELINIEKKEE